MIDQCQIAISEIVKKAALPENDKNYKFIEEWRANLFEINCEWIDNEKEPPHKVYSLNKPETKLPKNDYFCEYKFIKSYE